MVVARGEYNVDSVAPSSSPHFFLATGPNVDIHVGQHRNVVHAFPPGPDGRGEVTGRVGGATTAPCAGGHIDCDG